MFLPSVVFPMTSSHWNHVYGTSIPSQHLLELSRSSPMVFIPLFVISILMHVEAENTDMDAITDYGVYRLRPNFLLPSPSKHETYTRSINFEFSVSYRDMFFLGTFTLNLRVSTSQSSPFAQLPTFLIISMSHDFSRSFTTTCYAFGYCSVPPISTMEPSRVQSCTRLSLG